MERLRERSDACNNSDSHKSQSDEGPNKAPALRRATITLSENASIRRIYLAKNQIIALEFSQHRSHLPNRGKRNIQYPKRYKAQT